ncbi:MAG: efflux RND transporter permease subunit [Polyangia bacterium]
MWIVKLALRRPYTFVVAALLVVLISVGVLRRTPTDIFPNVDIPVISVVWTYGGLPAQQMERQITQFSEYSLSGNVAGIRSMESQSFDGVSIIRLYLHDDVDVAAATAQVTAISQTIIRRMPPGTMPPIIVRYSASSVPILQIAFFSEKMTEAEVFDHVNQRVRTQLSAIQGTRFPLPMGGRMRQTTVDLDPQALRAYGLSPSDVNQAILLQNLTLPTGSAKIGETEYRVSLNSSPETIAALNDVPIRLRSGRTIFVRDVGFVHDGYAVQTSIARQDGRRAVVLSVLKTGETSTTELSRRVRAMMPQIQAAAPPDLRMELLADQSTFVTEAIHGLLTEGLIAALLTATMILLFLGSWRSTLIVFVSIPLSVLITLLILRALGHTLNTMTLGGLALAVGILVDDATVEIENIHRNLALGKPLVRAILDGAQQIALPAFVASLSIGLVFFSLFLLEGPARYLFLPLGLAVGLSVMASYLLSRTIVPTLVRYLLPAEIAAHHAAAGSAHRPGPFGRLHRGFERGFERLRDAYCEILGALLRHRAATVAAFFVLCGAAALLTPRVGRDFFPRIDSGQIRLHVTAPPGTRIEETERHFERVESALRELIPASEREVILDQMGLPQGYSLAVTDTSNVSSADGEILLKLAPHRQHDTDYYVRRIRRELPARFPELDFYFQPADIVTQILNFGLPSPLSIQVTGQRRDATEAAAQALSRELRKVPGAVDVRVHQVTNAPRLHLDVDRARASEVGLTQRDVASDVLITISSSGQVTPSYWTDPATGNSYPVVVQVPETEVSSLGAISGITVMSPSGAQLVSDLATIDRRATAVLVSHSDLQPTFEVRADVSLLDLGTVAARVHALVDSYRGRLPPGSNISVRGQIDSMSAGFSSLGLGLLLAVILVYALMVVNFQSWLDPFIILLALPGAGAGIVVGLLLTGTTFSIPSLMGAIMSVGVATANSTLLVSFASEQREAGLSAVEAALEAGLTRLRPVLMTALAMVIGMLPMALGRSEGGEQNAALARAVIGGLGGATLTTLLFVPVAFSVLRKSPRPTRYDPDLDELPPVLSSVLPQLSAVPPAQ